MASKYWSVYPHAQSNEFFENVRSLPNGFDHTSLVPMLCALQYLSCENLSKASHVMKIKINVIDPIQGYIFKYISGIQV